MTTRAVEAIRPNWEVKDMRRRLVKAEWRNFALEQEGLRLYRLKSSVGSTKEEKSSLRSLGLRTSGDIVFSTPDSDSWGYVRRVSHLLEELELKSERALSLIASERGQAMHHDDIVIDELGVNRRFVQFSTMEYGDFERNEDFSSIGWTSVWTYQQVFDLALQTLVPGSNGLEVFISGRGLDSSEPLSIAAARKVLSEDRMVGLIRVDSGTECLIMHATRTAVAPPFREFGYAFEVTSIERILSYMELSGSPLIRANASRLVPHLLSR